MYSDFLHKISFSKFPRQNIVCISVLPQIRHMPRQSHSPLFDTEITFGEKHESRVYTIRSILQSPANSSLLESNTLHSTSFSNTFSLCSYLSAIANFNTNTKQQAQLHFFVLYFVFSDNKRQEKNSP